MRKKLHDIHDGFLPIDLFNRNAESHILWEYIKNVQKVSWQLNKTCDRYEENDAVHLQIKHALIVSCYVFWVRKQIELNGKKRNILHLQAWDGGHRQRT